MPPLSLRHLLLRLLPRAPLPPSSAWPGLAFDRVAIGRRQEGASSRRFLGSLFFNGKKKNSKSRKRLKQTCFAVLAAAAFCVYQYGLTGSLEQFSSVYQHAKTWAKEYTTRPEAGWRQATEKLNDLLPSTGASTRFDLTARVVRINDGDTISVLDENKAQHSIRFYGIDTPEYDQPYGNAASAALSHLLADEM